MTAKVQMLLAATVLLNLPLWAGESSKKNAGVKYGPANLPRATPLSRDSSYFRRHGSPDFWKLISYYQPQGKKAGDSVASVAMLLNAARSKMKKKANEKLITKEEILQRVKGFNWAERMSEKGYDSGDGNPTWGLSIESLGKVVEASLKEFKIPFKKVHTVAINTKVKDLKKAKAELKKLLIKNEHSSKNYILAHYSQGEFTNSRFEGHISPVGAYDIASRRVLILDVDKNWYEPYWVRFNVFFAGLVGKRKKLGPDRGSLGGGYVFVDLNL